MIVWINGAFGSGKSQTANELHRRIPDSFIYDPENIGFFIRKNIPSGLKKSDFQNYPMWRECNYSMLKYMNDHYNGIIIVPMTVVNPQFFDEIVGRLRNDHITINHFTLCASKEVLQRRLRSRGEGSNSWAAQQIDRCMEGLSNPIFQRHLDTNEMTIEDVVTQIASFIQLKLTPDNRGVFRKKYDKIITQLKQIRFFQ